MGAFVLSTRLETRRHDKLKVFIDSVSALSSKTINQVCRSIRADILEQGLLSPDFSIMVSSAGADKPLVDPRQYEKNLGRDLDITLVGGGALAGKAIRIDENGVTIETQSGEEKTISYNEIEVAAVKLPW